ncbi:MAG: hypothetical protein NC489_18875 [Ruminococcus flavefaciens]|nr:hypothetical protein [Ruminococcus flavefaciens]
MASLKEQLSEKGAKVKLQFSRRERELYESECGFTDDELTIFRMRTRGFSVVKIRHEMEASTGEYWSLSRVEARIRSIKDKILAVL